MKSITVQEVWAETGTACLFFFSSPRPPPSSARPSPCSSSSSCLHFQHPTVGKQRCEKCQRSVVSLQDIYIQSSVLQTQWTCVCWFPPISPALLAKHSLNMEILFFIFLSLYKFFICDSVCVCRRGASWKSSAAVSLLLAVHVCMSVKGGGYSENVRRRVCTWVTQRKTNQKRAKEGAQSRWRAWNVSGIAISPHCAWGRLPGCPPIKLNGTGLIERIQGKLLNNADKLESGNQTYRGGEPSSWDVIVWRGFSDAHRFQVLQTCFHTAHNKQTHKNGLVPEWKTKLN